MLVTVLYYANPDVGEVNLCRVSRRRLPVGVREYNRRSTQDERLLLDELQSVQGISTIYLNSMGRRVVARKVRDASWQETMPRILAVLTNRFAPGQALTSAMMPCRPLYIGREPSLDDFVALPAA